ncbi:YggS family pyridoxal phosphate-dependent enzyme [Acidimicrobiaceae bacterium]|nr:YggS family pyridoxal phosphate-dependent enzyme [Acidimicrobiaceae bacterium]
MDVTILNEISDEVKKYNARLLPVIKGRETEEISKVYNEGFREFGENRLEELLDHKSNFNDCHFHFIAPLQSRKIPEILENSKSVHTVSRLKEVEKIDLLYKNHEIFVQINIDNDPKKSGINLNDVEKFFEKFENYSFFPNGIMCIPQINNDPRESFKNMNDINQKLLDNYKQYNGELSMGMSNDYKIALDYGATIIRVGSKIFK